MDRLLITGGSGFLGGNLALAASSMWNTFVTYYSSPVNNKKFVHPLKIDIANKNDVENLVNRISPAIIIHTSAITNFNYCAENQEKAWQTNVIGTENIVLAAEKIKARLIYISSDLVYSGNKSFSSENDVPSPESYYGKTKLEGEKMVSSISSNYCIARISLSYGFSINTSLCFTEVMINKLKERKKIKLFHDEYRTPIYIDNLCKILLEITKKDNLKGLFNICGPDRISRYEFGIQLSKIFEFDEELVIPISIDEFNFKDKRPKDCSMNNKKAMNVLETKFWSIEEGLKDMKRAVTGTP